MAVDRMTRFFPRQNLLFLFSALHKREQQEGTCSPDQHCKVTDKNVEVKRYNLKNVEARKRMQDNISNDQVIDSLFADSGCNLDTELDRFMMQWDNLIKESFIPVRQKCLLGPM